jgi:hypothetical protein
MACESGNFTIADLDRKADYGPLNGLSTDLVNQIRSATASAGFIAPGRAASG